MNKKLAYGAGLLAGCALVAASHWLAPYSRQTSRLEQARHLASTAYERLSSLAEADTSGRFFITANGLNIPAVLANADRKRYQQAFDLQERGQWTAANRVIGTIDNPLLLGHVQAQRLLHPEYVSEPEEFSRWLKAHDNLPQTSRIGKLAGKAVDDPALLDGYGDDNGLHNQANPDSWRAGLTAWENGSFTQAAKYFVQAYDDDIRESDWSRAAAAYWASRALRAAGERAQANKYLDIASQFPRTFYGILALHNLGRTLEVDRTPVSIDKETLTRLLEHNGARRAVALAESGQPELADLELRRLFMQLPSGKRQPLLALAAALDLPSVQITMARALQQANPDGNYDIALYPQPKWAPEGGFHVDPALMFAFARQESGFRISAQSSYGAIGLMQLMPRTAELINRRTKLMPHDELAGNTLYEPSLNLTLGQSYLSHLMKMDRIGHNLLLVAAAYNAGPGKVGQWRRELDYSRDPLLFLERIPAAQTRHYVMQVMTNYWMYAALQGRKLPSALALAQNRWPTYMQGTVPPRSVEASLAGHKAL